MTGPDDCKRLAGADRDECQAHAPALFKEDAAAGTRLVDEQVQDQTVKDFIWLTITREVDPTSYKYCDRIQETATAERCRVLVSRPHPHRELLRDRDATGPPARRAVRLPAQAQPRRLGSVERAAPHHQAARRSPGPRAVPQVAVLQPGRPHRATEVRAGPFPRRLGPRVVPNAEPQPRGLGPGGGCR